MLCRKRCFFLFLVLITWNIVARAVEEEEERKNIYTNSWAVEIIGGDEVANRIAEKHGFNNVGQVGSLTGVYHFIHSESPSRSHRSLDHKHNDLINEEKVIDVEQQVVVKRVKRDRVVPNDPYWSKQWYLHRTGKDMNVRSVWEQGITGKGVVVTILDDGLEYTHPDLKENYDSEASYDFNQHDPDPFPRYDPTNENKHGTRCAGEVAAALNDVCVVGVAYKSSIGGVRMLDGDINDIVEGSSLSFSPQHIDIYSSSWGPDDDGRTVDGPAKRATQAFYEGITKGRKGLGSIFVWASGNGGSSGDSCNCDGYVISPYTLSISSATEREKFPWYAEECSSNIACTYSSGSSGDHQVVSTDLHHKCTERHTGTSASAPMAAGLLALALEVNGNLTWRDVQYLVIYSSNPSIPEDSKWITNGAGLKASHRYGFGLMDAAVMVNRARHWINVPERKTCNISVAIDDEHKTASHDSSLQLAVSINKQNCSSIGFLEHVQAVITLAITNGKRGGVRIVLRSPQGTHSTLLPSRRQDHTKDGFHKWPFMTLFSWGENSIGEWSLTISTDSGNTARLDEFNLILHGVESEPQVISNIPDKCSDDCKGGCANTGPQYCDTCKHFRMELTLECVSTCPVGTFVVDSMCRSCLKHCSICTNTTVCIECAPGILKLPSGVCIETCPESTYRMDDDNCYHCHSLCMSCDGPTALNCTQCSNQYELSEGQCILITDCQTGQYFDHRTFECRTCHETCAECDGKDDADCSACYPGRVLKEGMCIENKVACKGGEYFNEETGSCALCPPGCNDCIDTISCTSCQSGYYMHLSRIGESEEQSVLCVKTCPSGYYGDQSQCLQCPPYCGTCSKFDFCLTCAQPGVKAINGICPQPCGAGEYYNDTTQYCMECTGDCSQCANSTFCTGCVEKLFLNTNGKCVPTCPDNTVQNPDTGRCESTQCHETCLTCLGPEPDQCLSCRSPRLFQENLCVGSCEDGKFLQGEVCSLCHSSCATCVGETDADCQTCVIGNYLDHHYCIPSCRKNSYADDGKCLACPAGCMTCINSTYCTECNSQYVLYKASHMCLTNCPSNYHPVNKTCKSCISINKCTAFSPSPLPSQQLTESTDSEPSIVLILFFIVLTVLVLALTVLLILWQRERILKVFKGNKKKYTVLYTASDVNGLGDDVNQLNIDIQMSDSETELYTR